MVLLLFPYSQKMTIFRQHGYIQSREKEKRDEAFIMKTKPFSELTSVYISLATLTVWDSNQASLAFFFLIKMIKREKDRKWCSVFPPVMSSAAYLQTLKLR